MLQFLFRSVAFSFLLHGLLLAVLLFLFAPRRLPKPPPALVVDLPPAPSEAGNERGEGTREAGVKKPKKVSSGPKAPAIRWKTAPFAWELGAGNPPPPGRESEEGDGAGSSLLSGRDARPKLYGLIDGQLTFPATLAEAGKKGRARFTIALEKSGKLGKLRLESSSDLDLEYWVRDDLEELLSEADLGAGKKRETFTLDFFLNDSFPAASGNIQGPVLSFYRRAGTETWALTLSQTEASKVSPHFFKNREPQVGAGIDPVMIADWIVNGRKDQRRAKERAILERELREARDRKRRQAGDG